MKLDNLTAIEQMASFLDGSQPIAFAVLSSKGERYQCVEKILKRFNYSGLKRQEKGTVIKFLRKITGYSRQQVTRLIAAHLNGNGPLQPQQSTTNGFASIYTATDIKLLSELDNRHDTPNGMMIKKLCERAYFQFGEQNYQRLSKISVSHIYNLRASKKYKKYRYHYEKTTSITALPKKNGLLEQIFGLRARQIL